MSDWLYEHLDLLFVLFLILVVVVLVAVIAQSGSDCPATGYDSHKCFDSVMIERIGKEIEGLRQDVHMLQTQVAPKSSQ